MSVIKTDTLFRRTGTDHESFIIYTCNLLSNNKASYKLRSYVKQIFFTQNLIDRYDELFPEDADVIPCSHTEIEITSELMRYNPDMYQKYKVDRYQGILTELLDNTELGKPQIEFAVCSLAYQMLYDKVVVCNGNIWHFDKSVWVQCSSNAYLWNFITSQLMLFVSKEGTNRVSDHLESVTAREKIMKDLKLRLQDDFFEQKLDSKAQIISMRNGSFDTRFDSLSDPVPSDYVSVQAGVPYEIFDDESKQISRLLKILLSIFTEPYVLDFFITSCATFLEGYNVNKTFYIWWGMGNNAKSLIQSLVLKTLGEYCSTAPTSLITGRRTSSANATPDLCHVEKRLVVFLQEPNPDETIRAGVLKEMTGNDMIYVRQLFKNGRNAPFKAKLVLVCNNVVDIPCMDPALKRRIVVIPFTSTFLTEREFASRKAKGTLNLSKNARVIDPKVETDLLDSCPAFMYLICKRFHEINGPLRIPQYIQDITELYLTSNNYPMIFIQYYVTYVEGSSMMITDIYELFKDWYKRSYPGKRPDNLDTFLNQLVDDGYVNNDGSIIGAFVSYTSPII